MTAQYTLIYASDSLLPQEPDVFKLAMDEIQAQSARKNTALDVTGFLFCFDNKFIQILEGTFENLMMVFGAIRKDARHGNIKVLWFAEVSSRSFESWSMECSMMDALDRYPALHPKLKFIRRSVAESVQPPSVLHYMLTSLALDVQAELQRDGRLPPKGR